ncbi:MAG: Gfo/Idh/MocA family oxidoreductase [Candidatus Acidiferrum sp.]|jgi:predicted dehydrogenase
MGKLRFAMCGTGFWARYQLAGWRELADVECVAVCGRSQMEANNFAGDQGIPAFYEDLETMLKRERPDFLDIVTNVDSHEELARLGLARLVPVVCQKPLVASLPRAEALVHDFAKSDVPLFVNENWRWQTPLREIKKSIERGTIGKVFRARVDMISGFPVFANQPFLRDLEQFILTDLGSHILDVGRFLFGEVRSLYCQTQKTLPEIRGENVATVLLTMVTGATIIVELAYAQNPLERECFPQTLAFIEGTEGSLELCPDYWIRTTTKQETVSACYPPHHYVWADPAYDVVHSSIVPCQSNILSGFRGGQVETTGEDNLNTLKLVFAAYDSARSGQAVNLQKQGHA